jgi:purine catabolism regulator
MLTVKALLEDLELDLAAGEANAERPLRWVHISELDDPTPWLSGGELLLTTGIQVSDAASQRGFIRLLADHDVAALGFGTGFNHEQLPRALVSEASKRELPLFEVPYRMPFIAITKAAFGRLVNEQYDLMQRGIAINRRLERLVLEDRGLEAIVSAIATEITGTALVLDARGELIAASSFRRELPAKSLKAIRAEVSERSSNGETTLFAPRDAGLADRALVYPIATGAGAAPQAWLVAVGERGGPGDFERLILQQAVTVVALELMRRRVAKETERRLAGNVLAEALGGRLAAAELRGRLAPFGIGERAAVLAFALEDPASAEPELERVLRDACEGTLVATHGSEPRALLCAVVDCADGDPMALAATAREALSAVHGPIRAAASRVTAVEQVRRAFHEARCALEATAMLDGGGPDVASFRDLGAFTVLLSAQDDEALRLYCESVLSPIESSDSEYGDELLRSLEAFIEHNGQWERAARQIYCHRHTLRYRIKRIEELTGRDLSRAHDRIEFWLALRARELVS